MEDQERMDLVYAKKIRENCHNDDTEMDHMAADATLTELLGFLGFKHTVEEYLKVRKWFA